MLIGVEALDFLIAVQKLQSNLYEIYEGLLNKGSKVTVLATKKTFDYIGQHIISVFKENDVVYETKLQDVAAHNNTYLAQKS